MANRVQGCKKLTPSAYFSPFIFQKRKLISQKKIAVKVNFDLLTFQMVLQHFLFTYLQKTVFYLTETNMLKLPATLRHTIKFRVWIFTGENLKTMTRKTYHWVHMVMEFLILFREMSLHKRIRIFINSRFSSGRKRDLQYDITSFLVPNKEIPRNKFIQFNIQITSFTFISHYQTLYR